MADLSSMELSAQERDFLQHPLIGGIILFSRNFYDTEQLQALTRDIRDCRLDKPLLIGVDHEGGSVQRFRDEFSLLPPAAKYGELYGENPDRAVRVAQAIGWLAASELLVMQIDLNFSPCVDLDYGMSQVIGSRSFHSGPEVVSVLASAFIQGMQRAGMQAVAKHFPGHGAVRADSHAELPIDNRTFEQIATADLMPFKTLIQEKVAAIMPAHIVYSKCDSQPAGFSSFWLQEILRNRFNFKGAILSDDLSMGGAAEAFGSYAERAKIALNAGCDMVLVCNHHNGLFEILDNLDDDGLDDHGDRKARLLNLQGRFEHPNFATLKKNPNWRSTREILDALT